MIERADRAYLVDLLVEVLAGNATMREAICLAVADNDFASQLPLLTQPVTLVTKSVDLCIAAGRKHRPAWLERLVTSPMLGIHVGSPRLLQIEAQIKAMPMPTNPATARGATLLGRATPFVNRRQLRRALAHLETDASRLQPILVVNGLPRTGKTYTRQYVEHFVFSRTVVPRIVVHPFEFKPEQAMALGPVQLAKELVSSLGRDATVVPPADTNMKLYVGQLAAWVLNEAVRTGDLHWFVLDGFRSDDTLPESSRPRADTMDFLVALSDKITGGAYADQCRLILTGFNRALLTVEPGKLDEEVLKPCTRAEAVACIQEILTTDTGIIPRARFEALIADGLPAEPDRMAELNARLRLLAVALAGLREILPAASPVELGDWLFELLSNLPPGGDRLAELRHRLDALELEVSAGQ